jgi:hypothetical protein
VSQDVFDNEQLSAMTRAIDQIMDGVREGPNLSRSEVVHAVFRLASENGEFDPAKLARMASENLAVRNRLSLVRSKTG